MNKVYKCLGTVMPRYITDGNGVLAEDQGVIAVEAGTLPHYARFIRGLSAKGLSVGDTKVFTARIGNIGENGTIFWEISARNPLDAEILRASEIFGQPNILPENGENVSFDDNNSGDNNSDNDKKTAKKETAKSK